MKKLWKVLGITALAAALIPYRVRKEQEGEEDVTTIDALLWQAIRRPGQGEDKSQTDITLGFKSPFQEVREERALFTDDPEEAVLFADGQPEAEGKEEEAAADVPEHQAESAGEPTAEPEVTEEDFDPEL